MWLIAGNPEDIRLPDERFQRLVDRVRHRRNVAAGDLMHSTEFTRYRGPGTTQ